MRLGPDGGVRHGGWLHDAATSLTFGAGRLWASIGDDDSVARIDPATARVVHTAVPRDPVGLAVAGGHVFVASNTLHRVTVLDPAGWRAGRWPRCACRSTRTPWPRAPAASG